MLTAYQTLHAIRTAAKKKGIRQTALAAQVNPMLVSRFVAGTGGNDFTTVVRIATATGWRLAGTRIRPKTT